MEVGNAPGARQGRGDPGRRGSGFPERLLVHPAARPRTPASFLLSFHRLPAPEHCPTLYLSRPHLNLSGVSGSFLACESARNPREKLNECLEGEELTWGWGDPRVQTRGGVGVEAQSCPTLYDPINRSMPGLSVHHQLPEFTQTHVHRLTRWALLYRAVSTADRDGVGEWQEQPP